MNKVQPAKKSIPLRLFAAHCRSAAVPALLVVYWLLLAHPAAGTPVKDQHHLKDALPGALTKDSLPPRLPMKTTCGGLYLEKQGVITAPDFPGGGGGDAVANQTCHWLLHATGESQQINLYLGELYAQSSAGGVALTAHDTMPLLFTTTTTTTTTDSRDDNNAMEERMQQGISLGVFHVHSTPEIPIIRTRKPYLLISYTPVHLPNVSRNSSSDVSSLQDLHGFNLTYRITSLSKDLLTHRANPEQDICSFDRCSRSGRCLVSANFITGWCDCLSPGSTGPHCQYGPDCNPQRQINPCDNGGSCEYTQPTVVHCICPPNLTGDRCDTPRVVDACADLHCEDECVIPGGGSAHCDCSPDRVLNSDGRTCSPQALLTREVAMPPDSKCRYHLKGQHGLIQTPNFPAAFTTPIDCEWVVEAGPGRRTVIYFTEMYLNNPAYIRISGYDSYSAGRGTGEIILENGVEGSEPEKTSFDYDSYPEHGLITNQPFVVIRLRLGAAKSHNMARMRTFILDRFGFNITYVTYPQGSPPPPQTNFNCTGAFECKYAGRCTVSADYQSAVCQCAAGMSGYKCQYGPRCNPFAEPPVEHCLNGGQCEYSFGTEDLHCAKCPVGFDGRRCEIVDKGCPNHECSQRCVKNSSGKGLKCACHPGFRLDPTDNKTCLDTRRRNLRISIELRRGTPLSSATTAILAKLAGQSPKLDYCRVIKSPRANLTILCQADKNMSEFVQRDATNLHQGRSQLFDPRTVRNATIATFPMLDLFNITMFSQQPTVEKSEIALVCLAQGSSDLTFSWSKDGQPFDPTTTDGMWRTEMVLPNGVKSCQVNIENVRRPHQGVYTCTVEDHGETAVQSKIVEVLRAPTILVSPATPTVRHGLPVAISCWTTSQNAAYRWTRRGEDVKHSPNHFTVKIDEDVDGGLQLFIDQVTENAEYTCTATNRVESQERVVKVKVLLPDDPICPAETYRGISWGITLADNENEQLCPYNMSGQVKRRCSKTVQWLEPDFSDCVSTRILAIKTVVDGMHVGFGSRNLELYRTSAQNVFNFVTSQRPLLSRDLSTALDLLDVLRSLASFVGIDDPALKATISDTMQLLVAESGSDRSLPYVEKQYLSEQQRRTYWLSGKFQCQLTSRTEVLVNETMSPRYHLNCPVIPHATGSAPPWVNMSLALHVYDWASSDTLVVPEAAVTVTEAPGKTAADSPTRMASAIVDMVVTLDPVITSYLTYTYLVFDLNFTDVMTSGTHKFSTDLSVIHDMISCVEMPGAAVDWSTEACKTTLNPPVSPDAVSVHCLCRLSVEHTRYGVRITDNSTSWAGPSRFSSFVPPSYLMPVIIVSLIGLLILLGAGLFCWQRKKILSCLLRFKKRTCDFVAENFRSAASSHPRPEDNQSDIPLTSRRSTAISHPDEMVSLVHPPPPSSAGERDTTR